MLDLLVTDNDKYDFLLDRLHALIASAKTDTTKDYSPLFNEIVDFLFENFRVNKSTTTMLMMTLDIERVDRESLLVLNSTNLVYGLINGLVKFSRGRLDVCFTTSDGFKKFTDVLWDASTQ